MPPSPNGDNGRNKRGRFAKGNPGGPGNPFARRVAALRSVMLDTVSEDDLKAIVAKLVEQAKGGDVVAARVTEPYLEEPLFHSNPSACEMICKDGREQVKAAVDPAECHFLCDELYA